MPHTKSVAVIATVVLQLKNQTDRGLNNATKSRTDYSGEIKDRYMLFDSISNSVCSFCFKQKVQLAGNCAFHFLHSLSIETKVVYSLIETYRKMRI